MINEAALDALLAEIRACRVCASALPHEPRPVVCAQVTARILVAGQAPGARVHVSGIPFDDRSGDRLRDWMGLDRAAFYDEAMIAFAPTGMCFPGYDAKGADKPPRPECAPLWRERLLAHLPNVRLRLLVGGYAQRIALGKAYCGSVSEQVARWADFAPGVFVLPHPSWRNTGWLKRNPWFETDLIPALQRAVSVARCS